MTTALALPTRKEEAWRYSDLEALKHVWPVATETINIAAGEEKHDQIIQLAGDDAVIVRDLRISVAAGGRFDLHILNAGARYGRIALDVTLAEGAAFNLGAVQIGKGSENLEIVTQVRHTEPGGTSQQIVRTILAEQAVGTYLGKVAVSRHAQKTDSEQSFKAMLLDRTATANAKPELEIFADDVKCAHGAAIGELDKQAMFYLMSRGLPPAEARKLMLRAFIADAYRDIANDDVRERLEEAAIGVLEGLRI